jgi:N-acetylglucosamine kinase-like BadF-type ATPase
MIRTVTLVDENNLAYAVRRLLARADQEEEAVAAVPDPLRNAAAQRHRYAARVLRNAAAEINELMQRAAPVDDAA